jgi:hypothetical protein
MSQESGRFSSRDRDIIVESLVAAYRGNPDKVRESLPAIVPLLEQRTPRRLGGTRLDPYSLTVGERHKRSQRLSEVLANMQRHKLPQSDALQALEDGLVLLEDGQEDAVALRPRLLKLLKQIADVSLATEGKQRQYQLGIGQPARTVLLARGIICHMTWDFHLVSVEVDPKELAKRRKALSIVGIGQDTASDVAQRHDEYLAQAGPSA